MSKKSRRSRGRKINGILVLNKPIGLSSNQALQRVKWLYVAAKAGHTGSLDPLATGVLPLCFGEATKFSQFLLDADKTYRATITFGKRSKTGDSEGELIDSSGAPELLLSQIENILDRFKGEIEQVPSMYSALKHQGKPLYKLAREGKTVERKARKITIYRLEILDFRAGEFPELDIEVECSKGTYIRSLAEDVGEILGCGGLISVLHRTQAGPFNIDSTVTIEELEQNKQSEELLDKYLLPVDESIKHLPKVELPESAGFFLRQGQPVLELSVLKNVAIGDLVRVVLQDGEFLGVAEILADGRIGPKRLVVTS